MPRKPADPNRPAEWFRCDAGISCHARTNYLGQLVGSRIRARGLLLSVLDLASRRPVDGAVTADDLLDPITFGATEEDLAALVKARYLIPSGDEFLVREWHKHQRALVERRVIGKKAGIASAGQRELEKVQHELPQVQPMLDDPPGQRTLSQVQHTLHPDQHELEKGQRGATRSSPILSSSSESDPSGSKRDWDPREISTLGSDSGQGSELAWGEVESLLLTIDPNHQKQRGKGRMPGQGRTLEPPSRYLSTLHKAGRIDGDRYKELLDLSTPGWLYQTLDPRGFNDLVGRVTKGLPSAEKTDPYARTSLATALHEYVNLQAAAGGAA